MIGIKVKIGYQLFEDQAQLENITAYGQCCSGTMFRRGNSRRHGNGRTTQPVLVEQLGDTEVQQLDRPVFLNHDMLWLDIAMQDQPVMSGLQRIRRLCDECKPLRQRQLICRTMFGNRQTIDIFHDQPA